MAKNIGLFGLFTGKIGNVVGYKLTNSNNKVVQASREYRAKVSNPKTEGQAIQRMKLAPAQNFYRHLSEILDNAWQGQKYGTKSRQHFLSQAMMQSAGIPFIPKGEKRFFPGEYPVSEGSIASLHFNTSPDVPFVELLPDSAQISGNGSNLGEFSATLINNIAQLRDGDKITIIACKTLSDGSYMPVYDYFIIDTTSTADCKTVKGIFGFTGLADGDEQFVFSLVGAAPNEVLAASAIIVSRLNTRNATPVWERSNAVMQCQNEYKAQFMGSIAYQSALLSYMKGSEYSSDWYLNVGISSGVGGGGNTPSTVEVKEATLPGTSSLFAYAQLGTAKYVPYYTAAVEMQETVFTYRKGTGTSLTKTGTESWGLAAGLSEIGNRFEENGYSLVTSAQFEELFPNIDVPV